jgi:uridine kinase
VSAPAGAAAGPFVVGIAGGSGAGKTALAAAIARALGPARTARLAHDAYYRDRSDVDPARRAELNYDVPDALDHELFREHLRALRRGQTITPPRYCFTSHGRLGLGDPVEPREIVLVEGILIFHDPDVRAAFDLRMWVDAPDHLRLTRRIERDTAERGRTVESVIGQCRRFVFPAHARWAEPTRGSAHLVLLNAGRIETAAEVAASVIRARLERRGVVGARVRAA